MRLRPVADSDREFLVELYGSVREPELAEVPWHEATKRAFVEQQFTAQDAAYRGNYPGATVGCLTASNPAAATGGADAAKTPQVTDSDLAAAQGQLEGDLRGTLLYTLVIVLLAAAQAVAIVVIAYGFLASAVCVLVGPIFVPFFIVPKLEWLFWGWFRCFIQYAFYQVIATAVVFVIGNLILGILNLQPNSTISTVQLIGWFPVLFITFVASIYVLLRVPALTNHIFSGTTGGSSTGILEGVFK